MGAADRGPSPERLLRQCPARRDGGRLARPLRCVFRDQRWAGVRVTRRGGQLDTHRARPAPGAVGGSPDAVVIQVVLPKNLQILAGVGRVVELEVGGTETQRSVLDALEVSHPSLPCTVRDRVSTMWWPMVRFIACEDE